MEYDFVCFNASHFYDSWNHGSFMLNGVGSSAGKLLAWIGVGILVVHTVIGVILTVQSLQTAKQSGKMYLKQNAIFWARRASGLAILILLFFHIGLFGKVQNGTYILFLFYNGKDGNSAFCS